MNIDIPVPGYETPTNSYELLELANRHYKSGNTEAFERLWQDIFAVIGDREIFLLAVLLKDQDGLRLPRQVRFRVSECLLLRLRTRHNNLQGRVDEALSDLYYRSGMYISATGYLISAKLEGEKIGQERVDAYYRRFLKSKIDAADDAHGAYILGSSLLHAGLLSQSVYFLEKAVQYGKGQWVSFAALDLADASKDYNPDLSYKALLVAAELGNPEILSPKK